MGGMERELVDSSSSLMDAMCTEEQRFGDERPGKMASAPGGPHVLRSDCQQISAHPSERNASWMSEDLVIAWVRQKHALLRLAVV
jgi:hypothetical protein